MSRLESVVGRFAIFALVLTARLPAQPAIDPLVSELSQALSSKNARDVRTLEQRLLTDSQSLDTLLAAGILLAQRDMFADASTFFERCAQQHPASFEAKYNLALAQIALANFAKALETLHDISPTSVRETAAVEYLQGKVYSATNRMREARQLLESAYQASPDEENYALDLALVDIRSAAYVPAIGILQEALVRHPQSQELRLELALSNALAGQYAAAIALCRSLLSENPASAAARLVSAFTQCMDAKYEACKNEAAAGLSARNPDPYFYYLHARALFSSESGDKALILRDLDAAIAAMPACSACLLLRSRVLESNNHSRAAISDLETVLRNDPKVAAAWYRLSVLYRKTGRAAEALDALHHFRTLQEQQETQEVESFRNQLVRGLTSSPVQ